MLFIRKLHRQENGATAIEYGLIAALLAVGLIAALGNLRDALERNFKSASAEMSDPQTS